MVYEEIQFQSISVVDPIGEAYRIMKKILFQPFDMEKWFVIGFCAWLSLLAQSGGGGGGGGGNNLGNVNNPEAMHKLKEFFLEYWVIITIIVVVVFLLMTAISIVLTWLSSRGKFMFIDCVAKNYGAVKWPWKEYRREGNSLFVFQLVLGIVFLVFILLTVASIGFVVYACFKDPTIASPVILAALFVVLSVTLTVILSICVVFQFTEDFVIPLMYTHRTGAMDAWRQLWALITDGNVLKFFGYHLFKIVIGLMVGMAVLAAIICTCCIGCCVMMIPYIGVVVTLPIYVFSRAYSVCYLRQYGQWFDAFASPEPAEEIVEPIPYDDEQEPM
jgi:hypothetical protein